MTQPKFKKGDMVMIRSSGGDSAFSVIVKLPKNLVVKPYMTATKEDPTISTHLYYFTDKFCISGGVDERDMIRVKMHDINLM
ncbi:MAG: hypothetical protein RI930_70 [Pseudomonadota bacterium]|jgi:hypothetical protein